MCKDCLYSELCVEWSIQGYKQAQKTIGFENPCIHFTDKQQYKKVVFCKNCKYYGFQKGECNLHYFNGKMILKNDNDFCSRGVMND